MDDQRMRRGTAFHPENRLEGLGIVGISPQAVDGFGWESDQTSPPKDLNGLLDIVRRSHMAIIGGEEGRDKTAWRREIDLNLFFFLRVRIFVGCLLMGYVKDL
jgi:hypothetical protein